MTQSRPWLRADIQPSQAVESLASCISAGRNLRSFGVGPGGFRDLINRYVEWTETTEVQLRYLSLDHEVVTMLQTPRHWVIRRAEAADARPVPLIQLEAELQVEALERLADDVGHRMRYFSGGGHIAVLDTNVLLHYQSLDSIDWAAVVGSAPIRLLLPLRVIEELDEKNARRDDLASRARRLLPQLEEFLDLGSSVRPGVTLEVPVDSGRRDRPADADREILDTCQEAAQFADAPVTLVTGDTAMRLRAGAWGVSATKMPSRYAAT